MPFLRVTVLLLLLSFPVQAHVRQLAFPGPADAEAVKQAFLPPLQTALASRRRSFPRDGRELAFQVTLTGHRDAVALESCCPEGRVSPITVTLVSEACSEAVSALGTGVLPAGQTVTFSVTVGFR